ncbi:MAG: hypothetical protein ACPF8Z_04885 [Schleiferiaceae bacterium]
MKKTLLVAWIGLAAVACQAPEEKGNDVDATFAANCETVETALSNFQNEVADYSMYSEDYWARPTRMNPERGDSVRLEDVKMSNAGGWAIFDYELVSDLAFLPGVNPDSKEMDGSVRYYGMWKVTRSATDSTDEASVMIPIYSSFDFDADGKILFQQNYGDFTAAFSSLR